MERSRATGLAHFGSLVLAREAEHVRADLRDLDATRQGTVARERGILTFDTPEWQHELCETTEAVIDSCSCSYASEPWPTYRP